MLIELPAEDFWGEGRVFSVLLGTGEGLFWCNCLCFSSASPVWVMIPVHSLVISCSGNDSA